MEDILREPVELIDSDLNAVAGGALNGIFNFHSFNLNGSSNGNGNGNGNGNSGLLNLNGNFNGDFDGNILVVSLEVPVSIAL